MKILIYIIRRIILLVPVLIGITFMTFFLTRIIPGDAIELSLGPHSTPEQIQVLRQKWAMDRSVGVQYLMYLKNLCRGDMGTSIMTRRPVIADIKEYFPATIELTAFTMLICIVIGIPIGVIAALKANKWPDNVFRLYALVGVSMPVFWVGLLLLLLFYYKLGWLPEVGRLSSKLLPPQRITNLYLIDSLITWNWPVFWDSLRHIFLPAFCLANAIIAIISRMTRATMLEVLRENYIKAAVARGLSRKLVIWRHALRNALLPVTTVVGVMFGACLAGAVLTESIFSWPGMGRYAVEAITFLDIEAIAGFTIVSTLIYVSLNLLVDILYTVLDPRIKY
jgi:peptide/nickel transport system permease protein